MAQDRRRHLIFGIASRWASHGHVWHHVVRHVIITIHHHVKHRVSDYALGLLMIVSLIVAAAVAWDRQSYDIRDANGWTVKRIILNGDGSIDVRDTRGRHIQTIVPDDRGGADIRDNKGRTVYLVKPSEATQRWPEPDEEGEE